MLKQTCAQPNVAFRFRCHPQSFLSTTNIAYTAPVLLYPFYSSAAAPAIPAIAPAQIGPSVIAAPLADLLELVDEAPFAPLVDLVGPADEAPLEDPLAVLVAAAALAALEGAADALGPEW